MSWTMNGKKENGSVMTMELANNTASTLITGLIGNAVRVAVPVAAAMLPGQLPRIVCVHFG